MNLEVIRRHPIKLYFILAFAISWIWWSGLFIIAPNGQFDNIWVMIYGLLGSLGPSIAGIIMYKIEDGKEGLSKLYSRLKIWNVDIKWYGIAIFITPIAFIPILMILSLIVSPVFTPIFLVSTDLVGLIILGLIIGLIAGIFEEFGWSGFATPRLQVTYGALRTGILVGVLWSIWHFLPDAWGRSRDYATLYIPFLIMFVLELTAYRMIIVWTYNKSGGSLFLAIIMHACFSGGQAIIVPSLSPIDYLLAYTIFTIVLWIIVIVAYLKYGINQEETVVD
ncbi:MAG: CPBP family intramembrane metalloprotease [Promethearchaeota archaeon]|nr:MAG: CPBP family intramembrane metalloprotease [Candidatus Lokiarchaeota archaeon]